MMKVLIIIFMLSTCCLANDVHELNRLEELQWCNRVILIVSETQDKHLIEQLNERHMEIDDREIIWIVSAGENLSSNYQGRLSDSLSGEIRKIRTKHSESVLLIGKDGGIKYRSDDLDLAEIFTEVDSMPMRIREMQDKGLR